MKTLLRFSPTFTPASRQLDFTGLVDAAGAAFDIRSLVAVFNETRGQLIYLMGSSTLTGSVSGNVLTLSFDTTAHAAGDRLRIQYDEPQTTRMPTATSVTQVSATTSGGSPSNPVAFASAACQAAQLSNDSGATVEVLLNGTGSYMALRPGASDYIPVRNAAQMAVRRQDLSAITVSVQARLFV